MLTVHRCLGTSRGLLSPKLAAFSRELAQTKQTNEKSMKNYTRWPFRLKARIPRRERRWYKSPRCRLRVQGKVHRGSTIAGRRTTPQTSLPHSKKYKTELMDSCKTYHRIELVELYKMTGLLSVFVFPAARTRTFHKNQQHLLAAVGEVSQHLGKQKIAVFRYETPHET